MFIVVEAEVHNAIIEQSYYFRLSLLISHMMSHTHTHSQALIAITAVTVINDFFG